MGHETTRRCSFTTDRLVVGEWHRLAERLGLDLVDVVGAVLTTETTAALPPAWRGEFGRGRAARWIDERDAESPTLLVVERATSDAIGLLVLYESTDGTAARHLDVRLGYVLARPSWGKGLASELVGGLVRWARSEPLVASISGGVAPDHHASARVLTKLGFSPIAAATAEQIYRIEVR